MARIMWGFDFGHRTQEPGLSNEAIASEVGAAIAAGLSFDLVLSQDGNGEGTHGLAVALRRKGIWPDFQVGVSRKGPRAYLGTREVAERFLEFRPIGSNDEIYIACHQTSWAGTNAICKSVGVFGKRLVRHRLPYDPDSHQFVARGVVQCWLYKFYSLAGYILRGEIFGVFRKAR